MHPAVLYILYGLLYYYILFRYKYTTYRATEDRDRYRLPRPWSQSIRRSSTRPSTAVRYMHECDNVQYACNMLYLFNMPTAAIIIVVSAL